MRVYDPAEDLPPANEGVYALFEFYGGFAGTIKSQGECFWDPYTGWNNKTHSRVKVLKWTDMQIPNLNEHIKEEEVAQESED